VAGEEADIDRKETSEKVLEPIEAKTHPYRYAIATILISLLLALSCVAMYHHYFAPQIVAVDLRGYIKGQRDMFLAGKIDRKKLRRNLDKFENVITGLPKRNIILSRDAVIRNVKVIEIKKRGENVDLD